MLKKIFPLILGAVIVIIYTLPYLFSRGVATAATIVALLFTMVYREWLLKGLLLNPNRYLNNFIFMFIWSSVAIWIYADSSGESSLPLSWLFIGAAIFSGMLCMRFLGYKKGV